MTDVVVVKLIQPFDVISHVSNLRSSVDVRFIMEKLSKFTSFSIWKHKDILNNVCVVAFFMENLKKLRFLWNLKTSVDVLSFMSVFKKNERLMPYVKYDSWCILLYTYVRLETICIVD